MEEKKLDVNSIIGFVLIFGILLYITPYLFLKFNYTIPEFVSDLIAWHQDQEFFQKLQLYDF